MKQYLLLTAVTSGDFSTSTPEMKQEAKNYNCTMLKSVSLKGTTQYYFMSSDQDRLVDLCEDLELDGTVVEVSGIFDQEIVEV